MLAAAELLEDDDGVLDGDGVLGAEDEDVDEEGDESPPDFSELDEPELDSPEPAFLPLSRLSVR